VGPERIIWNGTPETKWRNDTDKVKYQFICSLINTCGVCLQYHMAIGAFWPIPIHRNCRCRQVAVKPGNEAPHAFVNFRELLEGMDHDQQVAAIGASNYKLLEQGLVEWEDIVTPSRVRALREVVANKQLTVKEMVDAGVRQYIAENAHASVHTPVHEIVEQQRKELTAAITERGVSQEQLVKALSTGLAQRVTVGAGPTGKYTTGPAGAAHGLPGVKTDHADALRQLLAAWKRPTPPVQLATQAPPQKQEEQEPSEESSTNSEPNEPPTERPRKRKRPPKQ
jgi:hypothetical protein